MTSLSAAATVGFTGQLNVDFPVWHVLQPELSPVDVNVSQAKSRPQYGKLPLAIAPDSLSSNVPYVFDGELPVAEGRTRVETKRSDGYDFRSEHDISIPLPYTVLKWFTFDSVVVNVTVALSVDDHRTSQQMKDADFSVVVDFNTLLASSVVLLSRTLLHSEMTRMYFIKVWGLVLAKITTPKLSFTVHSAWSNRCVTSGDCVDFSARVQVAIDIDGQRSKISRSKEIGGFGIHEVCL
ncbi:MAG: hypothetical protein [Ixodes ricinus sobemo-like virus 1]|nr:MAG: hypothetical protein [Ixodes ricinus sobemo-like virus 1]